MRDKIFEIYTVEELFDINEFIANYENSNCIIKIMNDLDFENKPWVPIGKDNNNIFEGELDGQEHIVKNLKIALHSQSGIGLYLIIVGIFTTFI
jgi:hypothetical protein